jgi:hypothetical protein
MPATYLMAWEQTRRRWWKQYLNTRYVVSCHQLDAPETKDGSYQAANDWWLAKKAEIDGKLPPHLRDWSRRYHGWREGALLLITARGMGTIAASGG